MSSAETTAPTVPMHRRRPKRVRFAPLPSPHSSVSSQEGDSETRSIPPTPGAPNRHGKIVTDDSSPEATLVTQSEPPPPAPKRHTATPETAAILRIVFGFNTRYRERQDDHYYDDDDDDDDDDDGYFDEEIVARRIRDSASKSAKIERDHAVRVSQMYKDFAGMRIAEHEKGRTEMELAEKQYVEGLALANAEYDAQVLRPPGARRKRPRTAPTEIDNAGIIGTTDHASPERATTTTETDHRPTRNSCNLPAVDDGDGSGGGANGSTTARTDADGHARKDSSLEPTNNATGADDTFVPTEGNADYLENDDDDAEFPSCSSGDDGIHESTPVTESTEDVNEDDGDSNNAEATVVAYAHDSCEHDENERSGETLILPNTRGIDKDDDNGHREKVPILDVLNDNEKNIKKRKRDRRQRKEQQKRNRVDSGALPVNRKDVRATGVLVPASSNDTCVADALATLVSAILTEEGSPAIIEMPDGTVRKDVAEFFRASLSPNGEWVEMAAVHSLLHSFGFKAVWVDGSDRHSKVSLLTRRHGHYLVICKLQLDGEESRHAIAYLANKRWIVDNTPRQKILELEECDVQALTYVDQCLTEKQNRRLQNKAADKLMKKRFDGATSEILVWYEITRS